MKWNAIRREGESSLCGLFSSIRLRKHTVQSRGVFCTLSTLIALILAMECGSLSYNINVVILGFLLPTSP
jgi:hypothetical protein